MSRRTCPYIAVFFLVPFCLTSRNASGQPTLSGFVEAILAVRVEKNPALGDGDITERRYPRSEGRAQLTVEERGDRAGFFLRTDVVGDATASNTTTSVDLREAYLTVRIGKWLDAKAGRQIATWGTGDFVFVNDLFAKDWEAFFTDLDDSYLKLTQELLRLSVYAGGATIDLLGSPRFTPDHLPDGRRLSVYNPFLGRVVGHPYAATPLGVPGGLQGGEVFGRVSGLIGAFETAAYGYAGRWPTPQGDTFGRLYYPSLGSVGGSLRGPVGSFLSHAEFALYVSTDDQEGANPHIANSQVRGLVGTEKALGNDWTIGGQYYAEWMLEYEKYRAGAPDDSEVDEVRSTVTLRITKLAHHQTVQASLFAFWGVSDRDWHVRPSIAYQITDELKWTLGASLVGGDKPFTTFGQFRNNSNVFTRLRYSF